jgi:hypothetical protein
MASRAIWSVLGLLVLGAGGLLSACDSDDPPAKSSAGESCERAADCADGLKCIEGTCYASGNPDAGEGGEANMPGPTPPVLSGLGESCTKRADCEEGLSCFNGRCAEEEGGMGGAPGVVLGGLGETCLVTADCETGLTCMPGPAPAQIGVCTVVSTGLTATGNDCHAECKAAQDCCQLPVAYHNPYDILVTPYGTGAASCTELKALLTAVDCTLVANTPAEQARCFAYDTFCNCTDTTWSCSELGLCVYNTECDASGATPGGCPALSRSGRALTTACSASNTCSVAVSACTNDNSCTSKPVADVFGDTCVAGECTCYKKTGCYRKCDVDLDCAVGQVCNDLAVCEPAPQCTTDEQCAAKNGDYRWVCDQTTSKCIKPCETDFDCNTGLVNTQFKMLCNEEQMCVPIGCSTDDECPVLGGGNVKNFCTPALDPTVVTTISSAVTDGPVP